MNKRILVISLISVVLSACSALQNPSKRVDSVTDFSNPTANSVYYEFSASALDNPSVLTEDLTPEILLEEDDTLSEDEDFTAENIAGAYDTYGDVVITVATHKFPLGASATRKEMAVFQKALDSGYNVALKTYRPAGFTYAMSSVGAVNPLSDIEVTCKLSERSANQVGQATCRTFFNTISRKYTQLMQEEK